MTRRWPLFLLILVLLAGCAAPPTESASTEPPAIVPTLDDKQVPEETQPPADAPTAEPTLEPSAPAETQAPATQPPDASVGTADLVAFIGRDGSLNLYSLATGEVTQLQAAEGPQPGAELVGPTTIFHYPAWSSDGQLLAYTRESGVPVESGYQFTYTVEVYDLDTDQSRVLLELEQMTDYSWRPGEHLLAFTMNIPTEYFINADAELATPIGAVNADTGEVTELVQPERGLALAAPEWSRDGRYLGFQEVRFMEGAGDFAYYDFEAGQYTAWERVIGNYDWSPDGQHLVYDRQAYMPSGEERVWQVDLSGGNETLLTPDISGGYASSPLYSPDGQYVAYWQGSIENMDAMDYQLKIVPANGQGEVRLLGDFTGVYGLTWSPDGQALLFTAGLFEERAVVRVDINSGEAETLAEGASPAPRPLARE